VGESVQIRPSNHAGVIAYLGPTHFAQGTWVGVELGKVNLLNHAGVIAYLGPTHFAKGIWVGVELG
jgi:dynactin complex subunit